LDPFFSTGVLMHSSSPYSTFKSPEVDRLLSPVFNEHDNSKRISGYQKVDLFIAQEALIIPLVQYRQTLLRNENLVVDPTFSESLSPHNVKRVEACVVDSDGCQ
jgi:peptide/nickel transport system substrate-binding protein